ncbi:hypothetical protein EMPS_03882 [Entomortierella parvispora]|uniref:Uncharacterized protein n=1 Tax=Entomortierella parvispora TaxID=205924 RepID=A0A9P3H7M2_9FUNG|nr:hypothetical protein EMPS_03882 [Entomortierella parvispora]
MSHGKSIGPIFGTTSTTISGMDQQDADAPANLFEPSDHLWPAVDQHLPDDHCACSVQQRLQMLTDSCACLNSGVCASDNHARYQVVMQELQTTTKNEEVSSTRCPFADVTSCADVMVACAQSINGAKDTVGLGLEAMLMDSGVRGQVMEAHPHNALAMIQAIAQVPRRTSTAMSVRKDPQARKVLTMLCTLGSWHGFGGHRACKPCTRILTDFWWLWCLKRGADDRQRPERTEASYNGDLPCGLAHAFAVSVMARTGTLSDGLFGDYCTHVAMAYRSGLPGHTLAKYVMATLIQAGTQLGGQPGDHASGWGAARMMAAVRPIWDEMWVALSADGESPVPMATCAAYALASDHADDICWSVQADGTLRYIMYDHHSVPPTVLHDVTIQPDCYMDRGMPAWSMALLDMWLDHLQRHWNVEKDMCYERYMLTYLQKDGGGNKTDKPTCSSRGVSWQDVWTCHNKNRGARAGTSEILASREI